MADTAELRRLYQARELDTAWRLYASQIQSQDPEWHLYGSLVAWASRQLWDADEASRIGLGLTEQPTETRARLLFVAAIAKREIGDTHMGLRFHHECEGMLQGLPVLRPVLLGAAVYNRGRTHYLRREYDEAITAYTDALVEFRSEHMVDYERQCLQNLSWTLLEAGRVDEGEECLHAARPLCKTAEALQTQQLITAYLLYHQRDKGALGLCSTLIDGPDCNHVTQAYGQAVVALIASRLSLHTEARGLAQNAFQQATETKDEVCWTFCKRTLNEVLDAVKQVNGG